MARVTDALTDDDLREHFEQFGEVRFSFLILLCVVLCSVFL